MPMFTTSRFVRGMRNTRDLIRYTLQDVSQAQALAVRDGDDGWNVVEILCHLRDFEAIFFDRAQAIVESDMPTLEAYDHEALVTLNDYASQDLQAVLDDFLKRRNHFLMWITELEDDSWLRRGIHPEAGEITLLEQVMQVSSHDLDHLEQMVRIMQQG